MQSAFESVLANKNMAHQAKRGLVQAGGARQRVALVLFEHFSMMAFTGAVDALVTANLLNPEPLYEVCSFGLTTTQVTSDLGIVISADQALSALEEKSWDLIILCGGFRVALREHALLRSKLRAAAAKGAMLGGLWNGAWFLAQAQLLEGYECAFHPEGRAMMAEDYPNVRLSSRSFVIDRQRISCAGANSSLRMMLEVMRRQGAEHLISAVEEILACDQSSDVRDISVIAIDSDPTLPQALKSALELMHNNIDEPLSVDEIARCVKLSKRHLERQFCSFMKATPTRYYLELRLTRARQLIQQSNRPIADIAVATGFVSLSHFQRRFREFFAIAPGRLRTAGRQAS
jgi:transcriptional regulator GlxA family with amidase domain